MSHNEWKLIVIGSGQIGEKYVRKVDNLLSLKALMKWSETVL